MNPNPFRRPYSNSLEHYIRKGNMLGPGTVTALDRMIPKNCYRGPSYVSIMRGTTSEARPLLTAMIFIQSRSLLLVTLLSLAAPIIISYIFFLCS
ncbi:hypothetical protein B0H12DRAFT_1160824 [Mycena haematopus]|nr:hypothetical protein B0H12DRAFT_1160824 [Mycena haematopus]